MAPSTLHGLNIVHPDSTTAHNTHNNTLLSDSDLLGASGHYPPELAAQLDLWTTLSFTQDDSSSSRPRTNSTSSLKRPLEDDEDEDEEPPAGPAQPDGHENVVTITHSAAPSDLHLSPPSQHGQQPVPSQLDLNSFLVSLGMSPSVSLPLEPTSSGPSLASILSLYQNQASSLSPSPVPAPTPAPAESVSARPTKKARKSTGSASASSSSAAVERKSSVAADADEEDEELLAGMTPTEDKRRRNTAASARFRAKKKEREQALERKAKDLDGRVSELERECEALRRENGWLRGLVVGATGAAGAPLIPGLNFAPPAQAVGGKRD